MAEVASGRLGTRLGRILLLLPYAIKHPGVSIDELSERFGVTTRDLLDDLRLVYLCGLPGYGPGDLIDVTLEEDAVYVSMADYFGSPLRLTAAEALALYSGGAAVAALPGMEKADALRRALAKLGRALGASGSDGDASGIEVKLAHGPAEHMETLQRALGEGKRVSLEYFSASRGALTTRIIDPWGLVATLGRWYLIAFDHLSEDERMFRIDRIKSAALLDQPARVPDDFDPERYKAAFVEREEQARLTLEISPQASGWFRESYPALKAEELADDWTRVEMASGGESWATTLVLRLGKDVRAVRPDSVMAAARALGAAMVTRHTP